MLMSFRWFGPDDRVTLENIRQIPGVVGIVSALHEVPPGEVWPQDALRRLGDRIAAAGLRFAVAESIPVHEDIKLGRATRDRLVENYCRSVRNLGEAGVPVLCYNFMPVFDWMRTELALRLPDGSLTMAYDDAALARIDLSRSMSGLAAWAGSYDGAELAALLAAYRGVDSERLWENLGWFLERVAPAAEAAGVRLALHPDDPPWGIFGLPRIVIGALAANDLPAMVRRVGKRIYFAHCRNVRITGERKFEETPHPSRFGGVNLLEVLRALYEVGFDGPMRPDHGRMIWGETGRPGYGLHDRALGAMYLQGLWEALTEREVPR
ncbi:MAG: mannonate dehydratase [Gemmatimonadetes bacterium]|nr:MAG: mannonate dehydratase [Gemmatimonadota bacterium]